MTHIFRFIPVMIFPAIAYALAVLSVGEGAATWMQSEAFAITMASGDTWRVSVGTLFLGFSLLCFFAELLRTALPTTSSLWANVLLACAFVPCLLLFLLARGFATDVFFLIIVMMLLDFLLDSAILVFTSRRTLEVNHR